jgi:hypothetical protein
VPTELVRQRQSVLLGALAALAVARNGVAAAAEERFAWTAPLACPDGDSVLAAVAELTAPRPVDFAAFRSIRGGVERVGSQWQLSLELVDGSRRSSRRLSAPSCEDLARAASVAIALALDSAREGSPASAASDDTPALATAAAAESEAPVRSAEALRATLEAHDPSDFATEQSAADASQPTELTLAAQGVFDAAALPKPALGLGVAAGLRHARWAGLAHALWLPVQSKAAGAAGRVEFSLFAAGLRGCYRIGGLPLQISACAGVELGRTSARGIGLQQAATFADWWLASGTGLDLSGELGASWFWQAQADAVVPWLREKYLLNGTDVVHRAPLPGFRADLGIGVAIP